MDERLEVTLFQARNVFHFGVAESVTAFRGKIVFIMCFSGLIYVQFIFIENGTRNGYLGLYLTFALNLAFCVR